MKRILVGAIAHESNSFSPIPTRREDFEISAGESLWTCSSMAASFGGIVDTLRPAGVELVPGLVARAMPGGLVEEAAYGEFADRLLEAARDVDGACLHFHGAMRTAGEDYCESAILRRLRGRLGPDAPICISLDMHANIVAEMAESVDAMVAYRTAPHVDTYETGQRAARLLLRMLRAGTRPQIGFAKIPFLLPGEMAQTELDPMRSLMAMAAAVEAKPGLLAASLANGHCWADLPDLGVSAVVVSDGDREQAQREAEALAAAFWSRRGEFAVSAEAYPVEEAVAQALAASETTVFLSDSGDNPGAGGTTDVTVLLKTLVNAGARDVLFASLWDADAVAACRAAGIAATRELTIGGKLDTRHGRPLVLRGEVKGLLAVDGDVNGCPPPGAPGPAALFAAQGIDILLTSTRLSFTYPAQLLGLGLDPHRYRIVVLKRGYLTAALQAVSERSILALSPGATNCLVEEMDFRRLARPTFPLDP